MLADGHHVIEGTDTERAVTPASFTAGLDARFVNLTQSEYDALADKVDTTLYIIT